MAIIVMANTAGQVHYSAEQLGAALNTFAGNKDYVIANMGHEMIVGSITGSLNVTIGSGKAIICGRFVEISDDAQIELPANMDTLYVVLRVDLTRPTGEEGSITYVTPAQFKEDNLNNSGSGQHDLLLAEVKTGTQSISRVTDKRNVLISTYAIVSESEYAAMTYKNEKTLYFVYPDPEEGGNS